MECAPDNVVSNGDQWIITIGTGSAGTTHELQKILSEFDAALDWIHARLEQGDDCFFALNIRVGLHEGDAEFVNEGPNRLFWFTPELRAQQYMVPDEEIDYSEEEFLPWTIENRRFWIEVAKNDGLHWQLKNALQKMEDLIVFADRLNLSGGGFWENEETQFGEVPLSVLAESSSLFVPYYTRLLRLWDMDHEVHQLPSIETIIRKHGMTPETEDLLVTRVVENPGQAGGAQIENLYAFLQEQYGDFASSAFCRRMMAGVVGKHLDWLSENGAGRCVDQSMFSRSRVDALKIAEERSRAEMEATTDER